MTENTLRPLGAATFLLALVAASCSPMRGYCAAAAQCDEAGFPLDFVGEDNDSVEVCVVEMEGFLRQLRANEEDACHEQARLTEAYFACVDRQFGAEQDACGGFALGDDNPCGDELNDAGRAEVENGDTCSENER